jgi:hypothetical protein
MGLAQKVLKNAFAVLFSTAHAQCPATFHWLEKITCTRDQVRFNPFFGKVQVKKQVESSSCCILFAFPHFPHEIYSFKVTIIRKLTAWNPRAY